MGAQCIEEVFSGPDQLHWGFTPIYAPSAYLSLPELSQSASRMDLGAVLVLWMDPSVSFCSFLDSLDGSQTIT